LYGSLFLTNEPVILHYNFEPLPTDREINLTPLAIKDENLKISEVFLDGQSYTDFNPTTRVLHLPAGVGGNFVVKYDPISTDVKPEDYIVANNFELKQNYPNPFNPSTVIDYHLPEANYVSLKIFNSLGEEVVTLIDNEFQDIGSHSKLFNVNSTLPSGVYFYRLQAGKFVETKKMILLK
jgi:hypothetical protein